MEVKDIMNKDVIVLHPDMTIREASQIFAKNGINGAPVVDNEGKLLGILTIKDILKVIKERMESLGIYIFPTPFDFMDILPIEVPSENKEVFSEIANIKVEEIMERRVHTVEPDTDIYDALNLLVKKEISRLPVIKDGRVVGIITRSDILKGMARISDKVS